ncbi:MAG: hypothetical protein M1830_004912 [Pleopsidium flavum]|nr:MAG: hypothetical protein M1830_004912 [Pleopsidium flavum]
MSNPALQIAETIQTASINRHPSPHHDINPSTSASKKQPVTIHSPTSESSIPYSTIKPLPRKTTLPPLPDLRFEQSYLASLKGADTWGRVVWITVRDQLFLPLIQGTLWTLALAGWRFWNRSAQFSGRNVGSRIRRWWWGVNNWEIPDQGQAQGIGMTESEKFAGEVGEYYTGQFSSAGGD